MLASECQIEDMPRGEALDRRSCCLVVVVVVVVERFGAREKAGTRREGGICGGQTGGHL